MRCTSLQIYFFAAFIGVLATSVSCSPVSDNGSSRVRLRLPDGVQSSKVGTLAYNWSNVCYAIHIHASDIKPSQGTSCEIPLALFHGLKAPGQEISINVPRGRDRTLEIFTYLRANASEACSQLNNGFAGLDKSKLVRVGRVDKFHTDAPEVDVEVTIRAPNAGESVLTQYNLPATCVATAPDPTARGTARITSGRARSIGGSFVVDAALTGTQNEITLSGGSFKVQLTREPK